MEDKIQAIYQLESDQQNRAASKMILRIIERKFQASNLAEVDRLLGEIEIDRLSSLSICGLIRFTAIARIHLSNWHGAYEKSVVALRKNGENPESVFAGIKV